jgi:hypothetical protein
MGNNTIQQYTTSTLNLVTQHIWEELVEFQDASLQIYELGSIGFELREVAVEGDWEEMARKELDCIKKASCTLELKWDCYESVVRILLVKTENPSVCV